jgi:hypothetical protein
MDSDTAITFAVLLYGFGMFYLIARTIKKDRND